MHEYSEFYTIWLSASVEIFSVRFDDGFDGVKAKQLFHHWPKTPNKTRTEDDHEKKHISNVPLQTSNMESRMLHTEFGMACAIRGKLYLDDGSRNPIYRKNRIYINIYRSIYLNSWHIKYIAHQMLRPSSLGIYVFSIIQLIFRSHGCQTHLHQHFAFRWKLSYSSDEQVFNGFSVVLLRKNNRHMCIVHWKWIYVHFCSFSIENRIENLHKLLPFSIKCSDHIKKKKVVFLSCFLSTFQVFVNAVDVSIYFAYVLKWCEDFNCKKLFNKRNDFV